MKYFIDTEFAESPCTIELISVAIVAEDGREFYAESTDFKYSMANDWVKANVIPQLWSRQEEIEFPFTWPRHPKIEGGPLAKSSIGHDIRRFIGDDKPQFWGYYSAYDWVVFCWLQGSMIQLPKGWPMYCRDIKQWCDQLGNPQLPSHDNDQHHALDDARWIRDAWNFLNSLSV